MEEDLQQAKRFRMYSSVRQLDVRKHQILEAVVDDYTRTRIPVGSQSVATYLAAWSSATIRNELANLVDDGYLIQPHASSGRVPSDQGYRYYVNFIMEEKPIASDVQMTIDRYFHDVRRNIDDVLEVAAMALAHVTDAVGIISSPDMASIRIKHISLVEIEDRKQALLIAVLEGNVVREQVIDIERIVSQEELTSLSAELNRTIHGMTVGEIGRLVPVNEVQGATERSSIRKTVLASLVDYLRALDSERGHWVVHDGVRNLLKQPEFDDIAKLEQVLEVLDEEKNISKLIDEVGSSLRKIPGVRIIIGRENEVEQLTHCSLVFTAYSVDEDRFGTMGVLGPIRMLYSQVAPRVRYIAQCVETCIQERIG